MTIRGTGIGGTLALGALLAGCAAPQGSRDAIPAAPTTGSKAASGPPVTPRAGVAFVDVAVSSGLAAFNHVSGTGDKTYIIESVSGGVALLDYDGDLDLDVYLANGSSLAGFAKGAEPRDALFSNDGRGFFTDVSAAAGLGDTRWSLGVVAADYDNDGWTDLYVTNYGPNVLYHNDGDGTFSDVTGGAGVGDPQWSTGATFFDYDADGRLDLYVANYVDFVKDFTPLVPRSVRYKGLEVFRGPITLTSAPDTLYHGEPGGGFRDVTRQAGIIDTDGYGFQPIAWDHDDDGDIDLYVTNDSVPHFLWSNDGDGTFTNVALVAGLALSEAGTPQAGMGATLGDHDGDGRFDLYITTFADDYFTLYHDDGGGFFTDVTAAAGLKSATHASLGWGCAFFDMDNDGDPDLFVSNGHVYPSMDSLALETRYRQKNQIFENVGGGRFEEVTARAGPGLLVEKSSRGAAFGDIDNDGDIDIVVSNIDDHPTLLRNDGGNAQHWVKVRLRGTRSALDAVGARVSVTAAGRRQVQPVVGGTSYLSSNDPRLHFGLGPATRVDEIEVRWPSGLVERFGDVPADRLLTIEEGSGRVDATELR